MYAKLNVKQKIVIDVNRVCAFVSACLFVFAETEVVKLKALSSHQWSDPKPRVYTVGYICRSTALK